MVERILEENQRKIEEAQKKLVKCDKYVKMKFIDGVFFNQAEDRLAMVEEQRKIDEERQRLRKEQEKRIKEEQKKILGKNNSRPKLSFQLKPVTQQCFSGKLWVYV